MHNTRSTNQNLKPFDSEIERTFHRLRKNKVGAIIAVSATSRRTSFRLKIFLMHLLIRSSWLKLLRNSLLRTLPINCYILHILL
ncbi:hypothetical protein vseg_015312 [Gypsophila vaccaria]